MKKIYETDWLASRPIFYNTRTKKVSECIHDVIDYSNIEFHPEGLKNYFDFGYSVFEQTPIRDVKFLRYSSRLTIEVNGHLNIEYLEDPVLKWIGKQTSEQDILSLLEEKIQSWEKSVDGEIVIPTSGGYDSRLLNLFIADKSRIRAFSYGISERQEQSHEVVYARKLTQILGIKWQQIPLGNYHRYLEQWDGLYGAATHAHGMYHYEFFNKIMQFVDIGTPMLSGIIGDLWSGGVKRQKINSPKDLILLGYTHGMVADSEELFIKADNTIRDRFWEERKNLIHETEYQIALLVRLKIILLSYLLKVPKNIGFQPWSPFLEEKIAMGMLNAVDLRTPVYNLSVNSVP